MSHPNLHPIQILFDKTKFITTYMTSLLDCHRIEEALPEPKDLSYPARSLWFILQNIHSDKLSFGDVWNLETLRNIVLSDRDRVEEEIADDLDELVMITVNQMSDSEFLEYYFDHVPTREDLIDYITKVEYDDINQEQSLLALMNGLFIFYNLDHLANEDWQLLAQAVGLAQDANHDKITTLLKAEQNRSAVELLTKGYDDVVRGVSIVKMVIQT